MTYYESAKGLHISKQRALLELKKHGIESQFDIDEFFEDLGDKERYSAQAVLRWLGY
jgi:hypothetical protein